MDDKAYVRRGTSVGFCDTKRGGIFQPGDSDVARKLPKYDWTFNFERPDQIYMRCRVPAPLSLLAFEACALG